MKSAMDGRLGVINVTAPRMCCLFFGNFARVYVLNALSRCFIYFCDTRPKFKVDKLDVSTTKLHTGIHSVLLFVLYPYFYFYFGLHTILWIFTYSFVPTF